MHYEKIDFNKIIKKSMRIFKIKSKLKNININTNFKGLTNTNNFFTDKLRLK
jgi:hypothetical protein